MNAKACGTIFVFVYSASFAVSELQLPQELTTIQEAYQASMANLHSGSGSGMYEIYVSSGGKGSKPQLIAKAKAKVIFDHNKFYIRLDYEKDDINRLESRIIIHDGTAILVKRTSKYIQPSHAEADIHEAKPSLATMRKTGFDFNPCELPLNILPVDLLSKPDYASGVAVKTNEMKDILGAFTYSPAPYVHSSFIASQKVGYNIVAYREYLSNQKDFLFVSRDANWDRKQGVWYVKSIDSQLFRLDGSSERSIFRYTDFDPNPEVPKSQFSFEALKLPPQAVLADHRPDAEEFVLHQNRSPRVDATKLDTLADKVKSLATPQFRRLGPVWRKYYLLASGMLFCIIGLVLIWRRIRARKGNVTPNP
jgi:hypothetical protein